MTSLRHTLAAAAILFSLSATAQNDGMLFYLSGNDIKADRAEGYANPNFAERVSVIEDGAEGKALRAHYRNAWSYLAPGNIYSDRGTVAFWWRSGEKLTETEFPLWRVSFADHTSWDMVWLRIDWNGHGYDAFVTDNGCARVRVHSTTDIPAADEWIHMAFSWDESKGVRLYLNGKMIASKDSVVCLNTGLDQFGPHQRIISPYQVQSAYIIQRGGDIDEVMIFDHQLEDSEIAAIARKEKTDIQPYKGFDADGWNRYYGFDKSMPPYLKDGNTAVRKVEITECYDYKRWYWKSCDGIRETTWPGMYNRSRLPGRNDYFKLPDWDCYSFSGKEVRFVMPEEWNYAEVTGPAYGRFEGCGLSARKEQGTERSFIKSDTMLGKGELTFTNDVQETPVQEFDAFRVSEGKAPEGYITLSYGVQNFANFQNPELENIEKYIAGRFRKGQRDKLLATTWKGGNAKLGKSAGNSPIAHIIIPSDCKDLDINMPPVLEKIDDEAAEFGKNSSWNTLDNEDASWSMIHAGLDGIRLELPALTAKALMDGLIPLNIAVMDPIEPLRYMFDFSFSVKPGEARTLWLDLRDRVLPTDKPLYIRIASGSSDFRAEQLQGMRLDLIFKKYDEAKAEHVTDRFNQLRDNYGTLVEEATSSRRYSKYRRYEAELKDLLRVNPEHPQGLQYKNERFPSTTPIEYVEPQAPAGIPEWAFLQIEFMRKWKYLGEWYLDNRQAPNGEFGGGLSDDSTFTTLYLGLAEGGIMKKRSIDAIKRSLQAIYDNGMLTNGVCTIQSDGLHSFEEGENTICQAAMLDPDDAIVKARLLQTAHQQFKTYVGKNSHGHYHLKGDYYGYGKAALEGQWGWNSQRGYYKFTAPILAVQLYNDTESRKNLNRLFDSLFAHAVNDGNGGLLLPSEINYLTDETRIYKKFYASLMANMWNISGDERYLKASEPLDKGYKGASHEELVRLYRKEIRTMSLREWYNTNGSPYIDRVRTSFSNNCNFSRIGGIIQTNMLPWNMIAWDFADEADAEKVAINVNFDMKDDWFDVEFFNTADHPVKATMVGRRAANGTWSMNADGRTSKVRFGRGKRLEIEIPAGKTWSVNMKKLK